MDMSEVGIGAGCTVLSSLKGARGYLVGSGLDL